MIALVDQEPDAMPRFDLYAKTLSAERRARPWRPFRIAIWTLMFASLALWAATLILAR